MLCPAGDARLGTRERLTGISRLVAAHRLFKLFSFKGTSKAHLIVDLSFSQIEQLYKKEASGPRFFPGRLGNTHSLLHSENQFLFNDI